MDSIQIISALDLHILVDLTAHTYNGRIELAASKPSAFVVNYLGFPGTSGCPGFDYSMVDKYTVPADNGASYFSEKLIYLPYSYQANKMPDIEVFYYFCHISALSFCFS